MGIVDLAPEWDRWKELQPVDKKSFDFRWRPDPNLGEPPYIYVWGNKWIPAELQPTLEYHVPGATERKYMDELVEVLPDGNWNEGQPIDQSSFDLSWRPDPREPPFIYVWGNRFIPGIEEPTLEYHTPGATERKYMEELVEVMSEEDRWFEIQPIDKSLFDLTWRPDPREPPFIYVWGNKWNPVDLQPALEYRVPGATERKYMEEDIGVLAEHDRWNHVQQVKNFDLSWRPDPREPPFIYVWGNKWIPAELQPTLEYHVPGATERKYMDELVDVLPEMTKWSEIQMIDRTRFDLSWRPDPREPPFIYVWGNKWNPVDLQPALEYTVVGATERKYMDESIDVLPEPRRWREIQKIDRTRFDLSWRPDPREPPFIYVWGNKWISGEILASLEYVCTDATERKYMPGEVVMLPEEERWVEVQPIDKSTFDLSWRPDPREPPFIYAWGNKWIAAELQPTLEYHAPGATERKYMDELVDVLPDSNWNEIQPIDKSTFDLSWRPDPREPPYIYVWGNKWIPAELQPTLEYHVPGAIERKYMDELVDVLPEESRWTEVQLITGQFDLSWRPDPREPPYIYTWGNKWIPSELKATLEYTCPGATERKYMSELVGVQPETDKWIEVQAVDAEVFDMSWRPDPREPPFIYVWGNKWIAAELQPTLEYHVDGATERKYMDELVEVLPDGNWSEVQPIDKSSFDLSWRPDPREPPFVYVWGNKWISPEVQSTIEYTCPGATERKYMSELVEVLPEEKRWNEVQSITKQFDLTWRPDPREPPFIYVWGNKWIPSELRATLEYICPDATERKYMSDLVAVRPEADRWIEVQAVDSEMFDMSWRPDPREPPFIYVWGNKWIPAELQPTLEYHVPGATERNYMDELVEVLPNNNWNVLIPSANFDFSWRPDPREPPFIYVWGNKWVSAEFQSTLEYVCPGATQKKYMSEIVEILPDMTPWKIIETVRGFDFSWRPDPTSPPYIYVFGNTQYPGMVMPTLEYHVEGAVDRKYITDIVPTLAPDQSLFKQLISVTAFDFSWRPDPTSPPYIYVWGNQWNAVDVEPTLEFHAPGATEYKYMTDQVAYVSSMKENFEIVEDVDTFDFSWRPDPREPAFVYVWGNTQYPGTKMPTVRYRCPGATQEKHMTNIVATLAQRPDLFENVVEKFDYSWRPDPTSPAYVYQFGTLLDEFDGPRFIVPGNDTTIVKVNRQEIILENIVFPKYKIETTLDSLILAHPGEIFWALNPDLDYTEFDFKWLPDEKNVYHINAFGSKDSINSQTYFVNGKMWARGYRDINYVEGKTVNLKTVIHMFYVDRGNAESTERFEALQKRYSNIQKTRYLNSWVDTINRCINRSSTTLCWILNSELDYSTFEFDFYPSPWQMRMVHVFGTQWSHWGTTFMVNKENFAEETKYIKIIEHLSMLNFVRRKTATATNRLYDIVMIDHGNSYEFDRIPGIVVQYDHNYLNTFRRILKELPVKKDHYVWICSSVCDYSRFDFSYICDPFAREQLHVFPSNKQKFGDTFLVDVNRLRTLLPEMTTLEDYYKINFNQHQRVNRLPPPVITVNADTHVDEITDDFSFPYAVFETEPLSIIDNEPMNLWTPETKTLIVTSTGGTRVIVPKEAKAYLRKELYDYPYIKKASTLIKSAPLDIVFLSNGEAGAEENYEHLLNITKGMPNRVVRVDGVTGRVAAYHASAKASETPWAFTVFAKLKVNPKFDWAWQPDRLQVPKHYIFHATNPVNGLVYGHQAMIAYNKKIVLANTGHGLDFTLDDEHEVVEVNSGMANFNTDEFSTWRTAFREAIKLRASDSEESKARLNIWQTVADGEFADSCIDGVHQALAYYAEVDGDMAALRLSYDWAWIHQRFTKYH
jgi:hypothetical protein